MKKEWKQALLEDLSYSEDEEKERMIVSKAKKNLADIRQRFNDLGIILSKPGSFGTDDYDDLPWQQTYILNTDYDGIKGNHYIKNKGKIRFYINKTDGTLEKYAVGIKVIDYNIKKGGEISLKGTDVNELPKKLDSLIKEKVGYDSGKEAEFVKKENEKNELNKKISAIVKNSLKYKYQNDFEEARLTQNEPNNKIGAIYFALAAKTYGDSWSEDYTTILDIKNGKLVPSNDDLKQFLDPWDLYVGLKKLFPAWNTITVHFSQAGL